MIAAMLLAWLLDSGNAAEGSAKCAWLVGKIGQFSTETAALESFEAWLLLRSRNNDPTWEATVREAISVYYRDGSLAAYEFCMGDKPDLEDT